MNKKEIEQILLHLQGVVETHLRESGSIQSDLSWLKKAFWAQVALMSASMAAIIAALASHILHI